VCNSLRMMIPHGFALARLVQAFNCLNKAAVRCRRKVLQTVGL
jgi:hypothetical protein